MPKWRQQICQTTDLLIRQGYSLIRRENVLIRREYARGRLTQISPRPQQSHPKSYKVVPRSPKHINIGPKIQQNSDICEKIVFATLFTPNACFWSPRHQIHTPKSLQNVTWKQALQKHLFWSKVPKKLSKRGPEIHPISIKIKAWIPRSPFLCSQVPLDRPMVSQGATGLPNVRF